MTSEITVHDAVEAVARYDEAVNLRKSPFHLASCGGCGAPAFKQPCSLCGFYPMGPDKGTWSPKVATFEQFEAMIDRSGPSGSNGDLITWHVASSFGYLPVGQREQPVADAVRAAVDRSLPMPSAREVWDVVKEAGIVYRHDRPDAVHIGWRAIDEILPIVSKRVSETGSRAALTVSNDLRAIVADKWVPAAHLSDEDGMQEALVAILSMNRRILDIGGRSGNLTYGMENVELAIVALSETSPAP